MLALAGILAVMQPVLAHHSGAEFDNDKTVEITGTIKEFQFIKSPHLDSGCCRGQGQPVEWSLEWGAPNQLGRQGIPTVNISPGRQGNHAASPDEKWFARRRFHRREIRGW
jgi:hypothetical protein